MSLFLIACLIEENEISLFDKYGIKATFFVVGDNVKKYPHLLKDIIERGHRIGNHTFNHVRGIQMRPHDYVENIKKCDRYFTTNLFRPPHGIMRRWVYRNMRPEYEIVFYDVVTRDYSSKLNGNRGFTTQCNQTKVCPTQIHRVAYRAGIFIQNALIIRIELCK